MPKANNNDYSEHVLNGDLRNECTQDSMLAYGNSELYMGLEEK